MLFLVICWFGQPARMSQEREQDVGMQETQLQPKDAAAALATALVATAPEQLTLKDLAAIARAL